MRSGSLLQLFDEVLRQLEDCRKYAISRKMNDSK